MFSLFLSVQISLYLPTYLVSTLFSSSIFFCLFLAAPGATANHLIPNALLRPHGTNNPYNTLLGESAVYNNPLGMYNTQGVLASFHSLTLWLGQCFFSSCLVLEKLRGFTSLFMPRNTKQLYDWRVISNRLALSWNTSVHPWAFLQGFEKIKKTLL